MGSELLRRAMLSRRPFHRLVTAAAPQRVPRRPVLIVHVVRMQRKNQPVRRLFVLDGDGLFRTDHHGLPCLIKVFLADQTVTDRVPVTAFMMNRKPCAVACHGRVRQVKGRVCRHFGHGTRRLAHDQVLDHDGRHRVLVAGVSMAARATAGRVVWRVGGRG